MLGTYDLLGVQLMVHPLYVGYHISFLAEAFCTKFIRAMVRLLVGMDSEMGV